MKKSLRSENRKRIYVVDDEPLIASTFSLILNDAGYETFVFTSAESVLEKIEENPPDVVLSDVILAGEKTGIGLAEEITAHYPQVRVILLSGATNTAELLSNAARRNFHIPVHAKPVSPHVILSEIKAMLAGMSD